jgi:hypothetical protein
MAYSVTPERSLVPDLKTRFSPKDSISSSKQPLFFPGKRYTVGELKLLSYAVLCE